MRLALPTSAVKQKLGRQAPKIAPLATRLLMQKRIGEKLRKLRLARELDQIAVAVAVGKSRGYIAGIENGHDLPGRATLQDLANYYGVSMDWLTSNGDTEPNFTTARTASEDLWLRVFREMPEAERDAQLSVFMMRYKPNIPGEP